MLRDMFIDTAIKLGIDDQLRNIRATLHPNYRHDRNESQHLRSLLASVLSQDSNCIDIGAYRGRFLAEITRIAPRGRHIAYEPLPYLHKFLINQFPSVDIRFVAVANEKGEKSFTYVKNVPARSGFNERPFAERQQIEKLLVQTVTLDDDLPEEYVPALIKIDVVGAERQVLEGAIGTISKYKPIVMPPITMPFCSHSRIAASHSANPGSIRTKNTMPRLNPPTTFSPHVSRNSSEER